MDGRIVGIVVATLALTCLVFVALDSLPHRGVPIAGAIAVIVGVGLGPLVWIPERRPKLVLGSLITPLPTPTSIEDAAAGTS